jgi:hypothetical protein
VPRMRKDLYARGRTRRSSPSRTRGRGRVQADTLQSPTGEASELDHQRKATVGGRSPPNANSAQCGRDVRWTARDANRYRRARPTAEDAVPERHPRQRGNHPRHQQLARRRRAARTDEVANGFSPARARSFPPSKHAPDGAPSAAREFARVAARLAGASRRPAIHAARRPVSVRRTAAVAFSVCWLAARSLPRATFGASRTRYPRHWGPGSFTSQWCSFGSSALSYSYWSGRSSALSRRT